MGIPTPIATWQPGWPVAPVRPFFRWLRQRGCAGARCPMEKSFLPDRSMPRTSQIGRAEKSTRTPVAEFGAMSWRSNTELDGM